MEAAQLDRAQLAQELASAMPRLDPEQQRTALAVYRLLAQGEPVARQRLAGRAGVDDEQIARLFEAREGAFFDDQDRLVGFWGMALSRTPHRMQVDGRAIRAWCAWDTGACQVE